MYSMQRLEVSSKAQMDRMFSTSSESGDSIMQGMQGPKKENMLQSVFNAINVVWGHFTRAPSSLISHINSPLSVTLVQNEGIISQEFFKSLTNRKEPIPTDNMYIHDTQTKPSLNIIEKIQYSIVDDKTSYETSGFNRTVDEDSKPKSKIFDSMCVDTLRRSDVAEQIANENIDNSTAHKLESDTDETECDFLMVCDNLGTENKQKLLFDNKCLNNNNNNNNDQLPVIEQTRNCVETSNCTGTSMDGKLRTNAKGCCFLASQSNAAKEHTIPEKQIGLTNLLTNVLQKVVDGVTDRLYQKTETEEPEIRMKRSYSPNQRRKLNTVAKGRGRGRGRSQLRRSGVSQTRRRKERTKHDLEEDIQDDLNNWQDCENFHTVRNHDYIYCLSTDENNIEVVDAPEFVKYQTASPVTYSFVDIKPRSRKPKTPKMMHPEQPKFATRVRYVPDCAIETNDCHQNFIDKICNPLRSAFRPRLLSESSVDSEDSYCIVFETGSEANCKTDLEYEDESEKETDEDQSSEDGESESTLQKVKFNLKPIVHKMIHWDYAYRAARRGPWEEMGRDRERFRGRINCIGRVLSPILTAQHRTHIWQERFAFED